MTTDRWIGVIGVALTAIFGVVAVWMAVRQGRKDRAAMSRLNRQLGWQNAQLEYQAVEQRQQSDRLERRMLEMARHLRRASGESPIDDDELRLDLGFELADERSLREARRAHWDRQGGDAIPPEDLPIGPVPYRWEGPTDELGPGRLPTPSAAAVALAATILTAVATIALLLLT
jgi:hypothetical protein